MYDPTLIAPYKSGLSKYYKPFLIGNDAFVDLDNCYSRQGYIRKREGSTILGTVGAWTTLSGITNASPPVVHSVAHGLLSNDMVYLGTVLMANGTIVSIASGNQTIVTCSGAPGVVGGQTVVITGTTGITTVNPDLVFNGTIWTVNAVVGNTIQLNVSTIGAAGAGGSVLLGGLTNNAFSITVTDADHFSLQTLTSAPPVDAPASGLAISGNIFLPIVGTRQYIASIAKGIEQLIAFTPRQAWQFDGATQTFTNISFNFTAPNFAITWAGTKDDFFYSCNYYSLFWATNNVAVPNSTVDGHTQSVGIRYFNGTLNQGWVDFQPQLVSAGTKTYLNSALIILPYKGFLVTLNTTEGKIDNTDNVNFFNRARWSQVGTPLYRNANVPTGGGSDVNAWVTDIVGKGGYTDADTNEKIVSAEIIQDTLIVGFQFSSWRLRFTGNYILPFVWERISTQFGSEGTFSSVAFDDREIYISRRGIVGATFNDVSRIDLSIPDFVEQFEDSTDIIGIQRIQGIRDYEKRMIYWIYAESGADLQTPNKILCWNYQDNTWSTFTQSFTTLGRFRISQTEDNTWQTWTSPWNGDTTTWNTGVDQTGNIIIVAGDYKGNVWQIMNDDFSTDNGVPYNLTITTNWINPYFERGKRCKLAYYDLYLTTTDNGQITLYNYASDNDSMPWLTKTVDTNDNSIQKNPTNAVKYIRVFLGMISRNHQIKLTMTPDQLANEVQGSSDFELQGIIFHTREEGRIKN